MSMEIFTPSAGDIIHETCADFRLRSIQKTINLVQYDNSLPIIAVRLMLNGYSYTLPTDANVYIRWGKKDHTYIRKLCYVSQDKKTVYFEVDYQMVLFYGEINPILELQIGQKHAGSSPLPIIVDRNPVQESDIESHSEDDILNTIVQDILDLQNNKMSNPMTNSGDIIVGGTSGAPSRLAKGTAGQVLAINSDETAVEWKTITKLYKHHIVYSKYPTIKEFWFNDDGTILPFSVTPSYGEKSLTIISTNSTAYTSLSIHNDQHDILYSECVIGTDLYQNITVQKLSCLIGEYYSISNRKLCKQFMIFPNDTTITDTVTEL